MTRGPATALLLSLGAGLVAGVMFLSLASGGFLVSMTLTYTMPLPLFTAGLALGVPGAGFAVLAAAALVLAFGGMLRAGMFLLLIGLPVLLLTRQALLSRPAVGLNGQATAEWYPPGRLLAWLAGMGAALLAIAFLYFSGEDGGLRGLLARHLEAGTELLAQRLPALVMGTDEATRAARVRFGATVMPAMLVGMWMLVMLANGILAQWGVSRMGRAARPSPRFADIRLPPLLAVALAAALGLALLPDGLGHFGGTLAAVLALPYLVVGLVVAHALTRGRPGRPMVLAATYFCLITITWFAVPLMLLGLADQFLDLRGRFGRPAT